jgi:hypothetical protein
MIIINICLNPLGLTASSHGPDPHEIKVVYDYTRIASYRRLRVGTVGEQVRLLALEGEQMLLCWGFSK